MNFETEEGVLKREATLSPGFSLFTTTSIKNAVLASACYLLLSYFLIGFKIDQLILVGIFNTLYFISRTTRRFILGFSIFIVYWVVFDYMKAFPNYRFNEVHIQDLYRLEKSLFGFVSNGTVITPNEFFHQNTSTFLDLLSGVFYLCWIPVPLAFAGILFFRNRNLFFQFSLTFFLVNIIGFIGYYSYPAAPPWYVSQYGFDFISSTPGNTAGLGRFDAYFGINVFKGIYSKSSNVFAAMPSLHAAYLLIVLYFGIKAKLKKWNILFAIILTGIWFAAVYTSHHYILDILAGIFCAITGIGLFQWLVKSRAGETMIKKLISSTSG
jgi:inositol phosphorylceramide synthase catalytic subunit